MIIVSSKSYGVLRDGKLFKINIGVNDVPEDVYNSLIVKLAMKDGSIVSTGRTDREIEASIEKAETKTKEVQAKQEKARKAKEAKG